MSHVCLIVVAGRDLSARRDSGINNPYVKFYWMGKKYKTTTKAVTTNPLWDELFNLPYNPSTGPHSLKLELWDRTDSTNGRTGIYVGALAVDFSQLQPGTASDSWYSLNNLGGDLRLRITFNGDNLRSPRGRCNHNHNQGEVFRPTYLRSRAVPQSPTYQHHNCSPRRHQMPLTLNSPKVCPAPAQFAPYSPYGGVGGYIGPQGGGGGGGGGGGMSHYPMSAYQTPGCSPAPSYFLPPSGPYGGMGPPIVTGYDM